jgi:hypothetical protein
VAVRIGGTTICAITLSKGTGSCTLANTRLRAGTYTFVAEPSVAGLVLLAGDAYPMHRSAVPRRALPRQRDPGRSGRRACQAL